MDLYLIQLTLLTPGVSIMHKNIEIYTLNLKFICFISAQEQHCSKVLTYFLKLFIRFDCCDDPVNGAMSDIALRTEASFNTRNSSGNAHIIKTSASDIKVALAPTA